MQAGAISLLLVSASLAQFRNAPQYQNYGYPSGNYGTIRKDELEQQQQAFKQWWGDELVMKLADLPGDGKVPDYRLPYSGHDYPDRAGGTIFALSKYDQAFYPGRQLATNFERMDVSAHRAGRPDGPVRMGPFGRMRGGGGNWGVPTWYGHCNGWTAAAIRHAEPQKSVVRNGVTFTPADIKGLLAEIYMYSDSEFLGGIDPAINPGVLHLTLANWLGRGSHPVGMETAVGEVVINFPVFNYKTTINKLTDRQRDVRNWITYTLNINREMDKAPANYHRLMYFHYVLDLNESGDVTGGRYYGDSQQIDMLWAPRKPVQGGEEGNKRGNPHLSVKEVLAIWRESVPEDLRKKWLNIDPTDEDRILPPEEAVAVAVADKPAEAASTDGAAATAPTAAASTEAATAAAPTAAASTEAAASTAPTAAAANGAASGETSSAAPASGAETGSESTASGSSGTTVTP